MLFSKMPKMNVNVIQFHHFDGRPNRTNKSGGMASINSTRGPTREGAGFGFWATEEAFRPAS
jgi:hypothetical protein